MERPKTELTTDEIKDFLGEIVTLTTPPTLEPDEITIQMYQERAGIEEKEARDRLNKAVREGKLTRRKVKHGGRWKLAYRKK